MALRSSIQWNQKDLKNLKSKIKKLQEFSQKEATLSLEHAGKNGVGRMRKNAPVDTGRLRREIEYTATDDDLIFESRAIDPVTKEDYAPVQEYGGRFLKAQPYFFSGVRYAMSALMKDLRRKLKHIMEN